MNSSLNDVMDVLEEITYALELGTGFASLGVMGIMLIVAAITFIVALVIAIALYIVEAIPLYKLAKKHGRKYAWLAWMPIYGKFFRVWVLSDLVPDKEVVLIKDKYVVKDRQQSYWIYLGVDLLGGFVIGMIVFFVSFLPIIGSILGMFVYLLYLIPGVICAYIEYIYLKDLLDVYKEDQKKNQNTSIIVTVLDLFVTGGWARSIYLYTLLKLEPLPVKVAADGAADDASNDASNDTETPALTSDTSSEEQ